MFAGMLAAGSWTEERGAQHPRHAARRGTTPTRPRDGKFVAIGAIEPKFYARAAASAWASATPTLPAQHDRARWPALRAAFAARFRARRRATSGAALFEGSDACFAPVLTFSEARAEPHALARNAYQRIDDIDQPAVAPRFARTPGATRGAPPERGEGGRAALAAWGFDGAAIGNLQGLGLGLGSADVPGAA